MMRQLWNASGFVALLAAGITVPITPAAAQGACAQIRAACENAGFVQGAARDGIGLQLHCMMPVMQGGAQPAGARRPMPKVDPQLVAECKTSNARFGPVMRPPAEVVEQLPSHPSPRSTAPGGAAARAQPAPEPGQPVVVRPPRPMTPEQRAALSALPPEDRPETGPAKALPAHLRRTTVDYPSKEPTGTIVVDTQHTYLYLVLGNGKAMRYGIGVGREGFTWTGAEKVTKMAEWPDWHPPEEMIQRQPYLPRFMAGGDGNPLGARALYLGQTLYRIHGTNQPSTIGTFVSSGCIRLTNEDIVDLYGRVQVGTRVVVLPGNGAPATVQTSTAVRPAEPTPRPRPKATVAEKPSAPPQTAAAPAPAAQAPTAKSEPRAVETTGTIPAAPAAPTPSAPTSVAPHAEEE